MKKLLLATDLSSRAEHALARAVRLARRHSAELRILHVVDDAVPAHLAGAQREAAEEILAGRLQATAGHAETSSSINVAIGKPFAEILREAASWPADLILIGTHQAQVLQDMFRGTTAERIISQGHLPVLVVRKEAAEDYRCAVVGIDFSLHALRAAQCAFRLAPKAEFHLVHSFLSPFPHFLYGDLRAEAREVQTQAMNRAVNEELTAFLARFGDQVPPLNHLVVSGVPKEVLLLTAGRLGADLLVAGTHGRAGVSRTVLGSVAEDMLCRAPCDVLVAKAW
jgi:nucleotide-binding universal stress UspA family protein